MCIYRKQFQLLTPKTEKTMKTKTLIHLSFMFLALLAFAMTSCSKNNSTTTTSTTPSSSLQNLANDETQVNNAWR